MNQQLTLLQRVVLHPTYRGAGLAAQFVRRSCALCPSPWIEALTQLGQIHPLFEKAGFIRVGEVEPRPSSRISHSVIYGGRRDHVCPQKLISEETYRKSRHARPVYYIFDNRSRSAAHHPFGPDAGFDAGPGADAGDADDVARSAESRPPVAD